MFLAPSQLVASLKMIASLAQIEPGGTYEFRTTSFKFDLSSIGACEALKPYIRELAEKEKYPVGSAAVEALVALREPRESRFYWSMPCHLMGVTNKSATMPIYLIPLVTSVTFSPG